ALGEIEPAQLLIRLQHSVTDVIDLARKGIHRAHRSALVTGEQTDAVVEVCRHGTCLGLASTVGLPGAGAHQRPLTNTCTTASARRVRPARGGPASTS